MKISLDTIDDYFTYHPPTTQERIDAHNAVNEAAKAWAVALVEMVYSQVATEGTVDESEEISADARMHKLNGYCLLFFAKANEVVADADILAAIEKSWDRYKDTCRHTIQFKQHDLVSEALAEIQFCRMMANQAIAIADIECQREASNSG